jgi:predicted dehydrogenase
MGRGAIAGYPGGDGGAKGVEGGRVPSGVTELPLRTAVIGCGDVALTRYLPYLAHRSPFVEIIAVADLDAGRAQHAAERFELTARTPHEVMAEPGVELVIDLTPPLAHVPVNAQALEAGKHVYSEKPFAVTLAEGRELQRLAVREGRRLASAPDTILGPNIQLARALLDRGRIGEPFMASMNFVTADRTWHPNPEFFFRRGAGPIYDEAPYFLSALVALLGPIAEVTARAATFREEVAAGGGATFRPEVPTSYAGTLTLRSGALVTMLMSFDVRGTTAPPLEIYGAEGTLRLGFPGFYNGTLRHGAEHNEITEVIAPAWQTAVEDARGIGVEEFAHAIATGTPSRLEGEFPLHLLEAMEALVTAAERGTTERLTTTTARPEEYRPEENPRNRVAGAV